MKWAIQAKEEEKNKPQTFSADGWTGNQRSSQMWWRNEQELLSPEPRTARTSELNGSGGGIGKGIRGAKEFCTGWRHQPGQKGSILSRLVAPTGTKGCAGLLSRLEPPTGIKGPLPSPPAWAIQLTCSCCSWLGRGEFFLISSPHLWRSLILPSIHRR